MTQTLGENVRAAREALGWSQQQLAKAANVSQQTIAKIENGTIQRSRYLISVAYALNRSPLELDPARHQMRDEIKAALGVNSSPGRTIGIYSAVDYGTEPWELKLVQLPLFEIPAPYPHFAENGIAFVFSSRLLEPRLMSGDTLYADGPADALEVGSIYAFEKKTSAGSGVLDITVGVVDAGREAYIDLRNFGSLRWAISREEYAIARPIRGLLFPGYANKR